jgi:thymidylate synthase
MKQLISGNYGTISEAWIDVLGKIYRSGGLMTTEYGLKARYINGMLIEISDPVRVWHKKDPFCTDNRIEHYKSQFKRSAIGKHGFEYTYIDRMVNYPDGLEEIEVMGVHVPNEATIDQLAWMREQLLAHRYESRRIQAITWIPHIDLRKKEDQPCFQRIWIFPQKNNTLDVHIHYRSWDWFKAFEANMMGFLEVVKDEFAIPTDFRLGVLRCFGDNVHIYEDDFQAVERVLNGSP